MNIAGHTMGTPDISIPEAAKLFAKIGLDGIEIIVQNDYRCGIPININKELLKEIKSQIDDTGLRIIAVTPYNNQFNALDKEIRDHENSELVNVIDIASFLGAQFIRIYGGRYNPNEQDTWEPKLRHLTNSMRMIGDHASQHDISLVIENHFMTMTDTAKNTMTVIEAINHPNVKILYDQANLGFVYGEEYKDAINLQKQYIAYVHVKDFVYRKETLAFNTDVVSHMSEEERNYTSKVVGHGVLPWKEILSQLKNVGYDGWLSLEYARRWNPKELPVPEIGMAEETQRIRQYLSEL